MTNANLAVVALLWLIIVVFHIREYNEILSLVGRLCHLNIHGRPWSRDQISNHTVEDKAGEEVLMKTKAIALAVVLLFSSAASSQVLMRVFHTYSGWDRLSRPDRMAYLEVMMDTLTTVGSDQNAQYYSDCARNYIGHEKGT